MPGQERQPCSRRCLTAESDVRMGRFPAVERRRPELGYTGADQTRRVDWAKRQKREAARVARYWAKQKLEATNA